MRPRSWIESFLAIAALGGLAFGLGWKLFTGDPAQDSALIGLAFGALWDWRERRSSAKYPSIAPWPIALSSSKP